MQKVILFKFEHILKASKMFLKTKQPTLFLVVPANKPFFLYISSKFNVKLFFHFAFLSLEFDVSVKYYVDLEKNSNKIIFKAIIKNNDFDNLFNILRCCCLVQIFLFS